MDAVEVCRGGSGGRGRRPGGSRQDAVEVHMGDLGVVVEVCRGDRAGCVGGIRRPRVEAVDIRT